jgi:outer membrane protein assembly factor BamB
MKKFTLIISLFFLFTLNILSQSYKYAWIPGTQLNLPPAKNNLENIVNDINKKNDISFVIITGSISKTGKNEDYDSVKSILDKLNVTYYIIPAYGDANSNENYYTEFKDLWKDNKFAFNYKGIEHIGLGCGMFMRDIGHFQIENLRWLDSVLAKIPGSTQVFFYSDYPDENGIDNLSEVTNRLRNHNLTTLFFSYRKYSPPADINDIPVLSEKNTPTETNGWMYSIIKNTVDSLFIYNVENGNITEPVFNISKNSVKDSIKVDNINSPQFITNTTGSINKAAGLKASVLWQHDLENTLYAPLAAIENKIIAAAQDGDVSCFDLNGKLLWQNKTGETILSSPAISDSILIAGTMQGDLISLNMADGTSIQTIGLNEPVTSGLFTIDVDYNGSLTTGVVAGTSKGSMYCYDINSFEMIWENHSAQGVIGGRPLLVNDRIIYGCNDGYLYCIDAKSGIINWKLLINKVNDFPLLCSPVSDDKSVFFASPDKNVISVDLLLGKINWQKNNLDASNSIGLSESKGELYIKCNKDNFLILSAKSGKIIKNIKAGFDTDRSPGNILNWGKNILFGSENGKIYLIDKDYNCDAILSAGTGGVNSLLHVKDNIFAASTIDGKIVVFKVE